MFTLFKKNRPNIIMIMLDGCRIDALEKVEYFRELKKNGVYFSNLIAYAPYTIGSVYSVFSGMTGNQNGVNSYYNIYGFDKENCFTLTQYLKENGYYTETDSPQDIVIPPQGFDKYRYHDEFKIDFMERHTEILRQIKDKKPFFLFVRYGGMHINMVDRVIKKYSDFDEEYYKNREKNFENYLEWVEKSGTYLKLVIGKIKEFGLYDDSIIFIFTDHGASVGDKSGEKAYGIYLYDYTIRCFLYLLGKQFPKGLEIKSLIRGIDILPTVLDILKLREKDWYKRIQGKSFLPFIHGNEEERVAYSETGGLGGPTPSPDKHNVKSIRTNKWKLIYNTTNKKRELYDLEADREEKNNIVDRHPDIEKRLFEEMSKY